MAAKGWISLHRKIQECFLWGNDEPFDRRSAWIDLLLLANHKDAKTMFDGKPIVVKEGQRITSIRFLAQRWGWSTKKTTNFLKVLESENMIVKQSDRKKTLITIVNYSIYQDVGNSEETQKKHSGDTEETLRKHRLPTNNNDNNDNNENNDNNDNNNNPPTPLKRGRTKKESNLVILEDILRRNPQTVLPEDVVAVLREWMEYKDQRKELYVERGMKSLLTQVYNALGSHSSEEIVECIRDSMACNYQGVTLDKLNRKSKASNRQSSSKQSSLDEWAARKDGVV